MTRTEPETERISLPVLSRIQVRQNELNEIRSRLEFHAKEASLIARKATLESFGNSRNPVGNSEISKNVAAANCSAVEANFLYLKCLRMLESLEEA